MYIHNTRVSSESQAHFFVHPSLGEHCILEEKESVVLTSCSPHGPGLNTAMPLAEPNSIGAPITVGIIQMRPGKFLMEQWSRLLFIQNPLGISL